MQKRILLVTLGTILFFFRIGVSSGASSSEEIPPCPGSVPGFIMKALPEVGAAEGDRDEAEGRASAQSGLGKISGGINSSPADITFDRGGATITGGVNASPVDLQVDAKAGKITGGANGSKVDLTVRSNAECTLITGGANGSPVELRIDWKNGVLSGHSNHSPARVEFQRKEGKQGTLVTLEGYANHAPVNLTYDQHSGKLTGGMGNSKVNLTFTKVTLEGFIDYFFLFLEA